jgi:hypothetical protein
MQFSNVSIVLVLVSCVAASVGAQEPAAPYTCGFEEGPGIFRLEAKGEGCQAVLDEGEAHAGRRSVKLVDGGGDDAELTWRHEWENWSKKTRSAALVWARHWDPAHPITVKKGRAYEVRAYVKTQDAYAVGIRIAVWSKEGWPVRGQADRFSPIVSGTHDWQWISARVACTSGDGELSEIAIAPLGKGTVWVDDVSVTEYQEADAPSINGGVYPPLRLEDVGVETASCLALEFIGDLQCLRAERPENWLVLSDDDAGFKDGVRPASVGRTKVLDNPDGTLNWQDAYRHTVFLVLPRPLQSGKHYRIAMLNVGVERQESPLAFDEHTAVSRAIKANQFGYIPDALKYAYLGDWLGSAGTLSLDGLTSEFQVVDAKTGQAVFRGMPALRMRHDQREDLSTSTLHNLTGEDVYDLDFSAFTTPGEYYVLVPGVGRSYPFRIADDVYAEPFVQCTRAILHQRCGIELKEPYTSYARGACHRGPAFEIKATLVINGLEAEDELVAKDPSIKTGRQLDVWGGYHDAADYDRLARHYGIPPCLLIAYEMFPKAYADGQLNIPESGNGIPDIVDEARWQVDFGVRMQDPDTGGVRGGAGPNAVVTAPADKDANPIYVYSTDPLTSLQFAGVAAQSARVLSGLGKAGDAALYLERARKAWAYGIANEGEKYLIPHAFAALELFRATGEPAYHDALLKDAPAVTRLNPLEQADYGGVYVWNVWMSYAMAREKRIDENVREACRQCVIAAADHEAKLMDSYAYRMPNWIPAPVRYGWGNNGNFPGGEYSVMAWYLTGQKRYRDYALMAADFSLGCHPTGTVFITGMGERHVKWALHPFSDPLGTAIKAPVKEPLPGMFVANVHGYPTEFSGWQSQLLYVYANPSEGTDNFFPASKEWPDLRLHADIGWVPIVCEAGLTMHGAFLYGGLLSAAGAH